MQFNIIFIIIHWHEYAGSTNVKTTTNPDEVTCAKCMKELERKGIL